MIFPASLWYNFNSKFDFTELSILKWINETLSIDKIRENDPLNNTDDNANKK